MGRHYWYCGMQTYLKTVICLAVIIILLQGFHMIILMRIQERVPSTQISSKSLFQDDIPKSNMKAAIDEVLQASIMDPSGMYMIIPNIIKPEKESSVVKQSEVSICTQATANHLNYLIALSEAWNGPVSVAVFTHGVDTVHAIHSMIMLHHCSKSVQQHVRFHLAHPISHPPLRLKSATRKSFSCDGYLDLIQISSEKNYEISDLPYPHNMLRNVAIMFSESSYVFMIDIDFVPSADLNSQFQNFIQRHANSFEANKQSGNYQSKAFVIPSFESNLTSVAALKKVQLMHEWKNQNIRPFYYEMCWKCQKVTDYDKWKNLPSVDFMEVGYYVDWIDPWEPFFIAKKSELPLYDGRFKQYGFNRISQVCEMHIAGFKFAVMNNGFILHQGFKKAETFHGKKQEENLANKELFRSFKTEMKDRYPESKLQC